MFLAFIASNGILLAALAATISIASGLQSGFNNAVGNMAIATVLTGSAVGIFIGRLYDFAIPATSRMLPKPISPPVFSTAAFTVVLLALMAALQQRVTIFDPPYAEPLLIVALVLVAWCSVEAWPLTPQDVWLPARIVLAAMGGMCLFAVVLLAPTWVIGAFVNTYNAGLDAGLSGYIAGWVAGLTSRQIKDIFGARASLEGDAVGEGVRSVIQRDIPVFVAVLIAYVAAKFGGQNPVVIAVIFGVVSAMLLRGISELVPE